MLKYKIILFLSLVSVYIGYAQNQNILLERLVSKKYIYSYDNSDSTFYRYDNNKYIIYNVPNKKKALFQISDVGFGFIQFKGAQLSDGKMINKREDSIYVSIEKRDDKYIIDYYLIKNKQKTTKIDYPVMRSDTAIGYSKALMSSSYTVPFIRIMDVLTKENIFQYIESRITWKEGNSKYYIDVDNSNMEHFNIIINRFIMENIKSPNSANSKNVCKVDLKFMTFRTSKRQVYSLINNMKCNQIAHKEEKEKIDIKECEFTDDLRKEIFIAQNFAPIVFSESNRLLSSNREIQNIFEVNDSLIRYTDKSEESNKIDTFNISVIKLKKQNYILGYNQFANEEELDLVLFDYTPIKNDTIVNIKSAINDSILCIDWIQLNDNVRDKILLKIDKQEFKIIYDNQKVSIDKSFILKSDKIINEFIVKNLSKEVKNYPYEVSIGWKGTGIRFFCSRKIGNEFINRIITQIKQTSR